ncbi:hypothetical protein CYG49_03250 [Candidatus Saccharibacteria bacterium]|nr:MAG: hypothetical protein CYG49_03250 [Candidatus Saccharibacteria bacterium]
MSEHQSLSNHFDMLALLTPEEQEAYLGKRRLLTAETILSVAGLVRVAGGEASADMAAQLRQKLTDMSLEGLETVKGLAQQLEQRLSGVDQLGTSASFSRLLAMDLPVTEAVVQNEAGTISEYVEPAQDEPEAEMYQPEPVIEAAPETQSEQELPFNPRHLNSFLKKCLGEDEAARVLCQPAEDIVALVEELIALYESGNKRKATVPTQVARLRMYLDGTPLATIAEQEDISAQGARVSYDKLVEIIQRSLRGRPPTSITRQPAAVDRKRVVPTQATPVATSALAAQVSPTREVPLARSPEQTAEDLPAYEVLTEAFVEALDLDSSLKTALSSLLDPKNHGEITDNKREVCRLINERLMSYGVQLEDICPKGLGVCERTRRVLGFYKSYGELVQRDPVSVSVQQREHDRRMRTSGSVPNDITKSIYTGLVYVVEALSGKPSAIISKSIA